MSSWIVGNSNLDCWWKYVVAGVNVVEVIMKCLCQDPERWVCPQPLPVCELWWDGLLRGGHEGCQHLQDGRPQISIRHTKLQPLHWFSTALRWGDMRICVCVCLCVRCLAVFFVGWKFLVFVLPSVSEFRLIPSSNASRATQFSHEVLRSQGEWEFLHLSITNTNFTYHRKTWEQLIYTVRTKFCSGFPALTFYSSPWLITFSFECS